VRNSLLPRLEIAPSRALPPLACERGVRPIQAACVTPAAKAGRIGHHRLDGGGNDRADAGNGRQAAGVLVGFDGSDDILVELLDPSGQGPDLRHQVLQRGAGHIGKAGIFVIGDDLQELGEAGPALGRDNAQFGQVAAQRIGELDPLTHQHLAGLEPHPRRLLVNGFDRHEAHGRPGHRRADGCGIGGVGLVAQAAKV
jgi:hypothetical protein